MPEDLADSGSAKLAGCLNLIIVVDKQIDFSGKRWILGQGPDAPGDEELVGFGNRVSRVSSVAQAAWAIFSGHEHIHFESSLVIVLVLSNLPSTVRCLNPFESLDDGQS